MLYAQFYQTSAWPPGSTELVEACADCSVIILDARYRMVDNIAVATGECVKRGYAAYQLRRAENFNRQTVNVTEVIEVLQKSTVK